MRPTSFYVVLIALTFVFGVVVILNPHLDFAPKEHSFSSRPNFNLRPLPTVKTLNDENKPRTSPSPPSTPNPTKHSPSVELTTSPTTTAVTRPTTTSNFEKKGSREKTKPTASTTTRPKRVVVKTPTTPTIPPLPSITTPPPIKKPIS